MSFEEGVMEWERFKVLVDAVQNKIKKEFGLNIEVLAKGSCADEPEI
jgi:hypothetical protein